MTLAGYTIIIIAFVIFWLVQYLLTMWQIKRYNKRLGQLRRLGLVSVGKAGSAWRRRVYGVLVVDKRDRIVHAEQLSGWTVFAQLQPVAGLDGRPISDITNDAVLLSISPKLRLAMKDAVGYIEMGRKRSTARATNDGQRVPASSATS
ncbi:MAG: transcriptional regulator GutM [Anaerolineae bacterium]